MAGRRKKKGYRSYSKKIPLATAAGMAATVLGGQDEGGLSVMSRLARQEYEVAAGDICLNLTGYNIRTNEFNLGKSNLMPLIVGAAVSWGASKFGINRRLQGLPVKL